MKKFFTIFALLCALIPTRAQYESFFGRESWEYDMAYVPVMYSTEYNPNLLGCITENFQFNVTDTVMLNGYIYYYCQEPNLFKLKEDTTKGQLYVYDGITEVLLCDMSLNVGDTFTLSVPHPSGLEFAWHNISMTVDSITYINGKKNIHLTGDPYYMPTFYGSYNFSMRFMEGIGPMYGINPYNPFALRGLMCLRKDDTLYYMTHPDVGCWQNVYDVPDYQESIMSLYPNPASQGLNLRFEEQEEVLGEIYVRDLTGRISLRANINSTVLNLDVSKLSQGVYTLTFIGDNRKITKKFVVK